MKLLDSIKIRSSGDKHVELYQGDLTDLSEADRFDLLVVSAFPDNYIPIFSTLIGALHRKGLSVETLSLAKDIDLRATFSCWLSMEFTPHDPGLKFRRILCFEPLVSESPPELVGDIFRALTPILAEKTDIKTVAMPVVAAGNQGYSVRTMFKPQLETAIHWLGIGLPLDRIKIVTRTDADAQEALQILSETKSKYLQIASKTHPEEVEYDIFISYSRNNAIESAALEKALREARPSVRIFVDRKALNIGSAWQPEIFESLDKCRKVVALLSPDYLGSKVCKEEFNIVWIRGRETDEDVISPVYLYTTQLPTYMKYRNYFDCREGDKLKIVEASKMLLSSIDGI